MFDNESIVKSVARRVFPSMGKFSDGVAKLDQWRAYLTVADKVTWLTVKLGLDLLFQVEARNGHVEARYALPAVVELGSGEKRYGTAWAGSRRWCVDGWADIPSVAAGIRRFFNDTGGLFEKEAEKVHKILEESDN